MGLKKTYLKLLRAHAKRRLDKAQKHYQKIMQMTLEEASERKNRPTTQETRVD